MPLVLACAEAKEISTEDYDNREYPASIKVAQVSPLRPRVQQCCALLPAEQAGYVSARFL